MAGRLSRLSKQVQCQAATSQAPDRTLAVHAPWPGPPRPLACPATPPGPGPAHCHLGPAPITLPLPCLWPPSAGRPVSSGSFWPRAASPAVRAAWELDRRAPVPMAGSAGTTPDSWSLQEKRASEPSALRVSEELVRPAQEAQPRPRCRSRSRWRAGPPSSTPPGTGRFRGPRTGWGSCREQFHRSPFHPESFSVHLEASQGIRLPRVTRGPSRSRTGSPESSSRVFQKLPCSFYSKRHILTVTTKPKQNPRAAFCSLEKLSRPQDIRLRGCPPHKMSGK